MYYALFFFFFQAEDGIRDKLVTGVQTCALPISLDSFPALAARNGCHAPSERQPRSCTSSWAIPSLHVKPKGRDWCTKPSAARLSIAQWRLHDACRHIRRNQLLTSSVSSATPPRRRWHRDWRSNEISS